MNATFIEAVAILLREGLEAILVLAALAAYLSRAGAEDWLQGLRTRAAAALVAIIAAAWVFEHFYNGVHSDVFEGVIIFLAAGLLFYVSGWLFLKQDPRAWQAYLKRQTDKALLARSQYVIALLAFFAVLREGGETVLFLHVLAKTSGGWGTALVSGIVAPFAAPAAALWDPYQDHAQAAVARRVPDHLGVPLPDGPQIRRRGPAGIPGAGARALRHGPRSRLADGPRPQSNLGGAGGANGGGAVGHRRCRHDDRRTPTAPLGKPVTGAGRPPPGESSQVERLRGTKPEHVLGVILFGIPGLCVRKDGEATAVLDQPRDDVAEQPGVKRKLATAARVRADRIVVHASDG